ncbi:glycosyltransferase family 2 protein [Candidatus Marinimicrobia bacterium]|nr:glycosyltransferase family 2 protein [Candidatus Neomarinimicrobiota bacterium]|tara:strand:+ start:2092 stop:3129 length:1038 start_codon:yes stop_codon:yes gene_type:complete
MKNPKVSIIIPHWNGIDILSECLESLLQTDYHNLEIIVVDNASTDGSPDLISLNFPQVKLLENSQNYGYAGGCNRGAEIADGDYIVFLNNDTIQDSKWISPLVDFLNLNPKVAAVQPKILNFYDREKFDYAGAAGGWLDILGFPFARGRVFNDQEKDKGQYNKIRPVFWTSGTAFMIRKFDFESAGRFDESFFAHQEEIDLCWRLHLMDKETWAIPSSVVFHKNGATLPMFSRKKQYLNHRNSLQMILSNYSLPLTLYIFPIRFTLELVALVYSFIRMDLNHAIGIIQSLLWIVSHPFSILKRRKQIKQIRIVKDKKVLPWLYWGSVVFDYYIRGKKHSANIIKE